MAAPRLGLTRNPFLKIKDAYSVFPLTIWDLDHTLGMTKSLKAEIRDDGTAREDCSSAIAYKSALGSSKNNVSIFNPQIMTNLLKLYGPPEGSTIYDPFGGGGTRAITCAGAGYKYIGVELRDKEVDAINNRVAELDNAHGTNIAANINLIHGNSIDPGLDPNIADMLITCPPYYNMEKYNGGEQDLSMAATYGDFLDMLWNVIEQADYILKPGSLAIWIVGLHRDKDSGLLPMHHDIAYMYHNLGGYLFKEEIILHAKNTGSVQRVGNFLRGKNLLVRIHEYCLIFEKRA